MSIDLAKKNFIELKKKADDVASSFGLGNQKAKVALALDISGSMASTFKNGTVQKVVEELLALGVKFDDNQAIDIFLFGKHDYEVGELVESNFYGYVDNKIVKSYPLEAETRYAGVINRIVKKYTTEKKGFFRKATAINGPLEEPVFVIFITDGDNQDKPQTEKAIRAASKLGIFWQFVGIGNAGFQFLEKLDNLSGRFVDNANFFKINNITKIDETSLYTKLLQEFPDWIKTAREHQLIN